MRAVILVTGHAPWLETQNHLLPSFLFPLGDRPFLHHVVEYLSQKGIKRLDFILSRMPEKIEASLGTGSRWGLCFDYHLVRDPARPYRRIRTILSDEASDFWLIHGDRLPRFNLSSNTRAWIVDPNGKPAGWGFLPGDSARNFNSETKEEDLLGLIELPFVKSALTLEARSPAGILAANTLLLEKKFPELLLKAGEVEPGVWLARNVVMHPTANLLPPVLIGSDCRISQGAQVGPCVVVGQGSYLGKRSEVSDTVVFPGSFVGDELEIKRTLVDRNLLISVRLGVALEINEDFLLSSMAGGWFTKKLVRALARAFALVFLVWSFPFGAVFLFYSISKGLRPVFKKRQVLRQPLPREASLWTNCSLLSLSGKFKCRPEDGLADFFLRFLPGLLSVIKGDLAMVGLPPRQDKEIEQLPVVRKNLCHLAKAGLVDESSVVFGPDPDPDELYSSEAFYAARAGLRLDIRILLRYLGRICGLLRPGFDKR
ncbi:nucleotidyltransferase family protein [Dethiosulfatarculus sandiegensis]|uniref:Glucose-1-phosphate adenylyltransferase/Bifunctional protein GlmU-like C-terminal hexapeptide domain-containing protein n=1 Tax=Dethiosulfatarculus sandiegensis TaxID=1429043 RepID=A0A0D2GN32_9BACT|nr:NDP-sugar synthase [Dethiosulfatarculus sandiegensis]KIX16017.1 hypothetical protein X474_00175 [Dethiosulfatarculus sandiegensis]